MYTPDWTHKEYKCKSRINHKLNLNLMQGVNESTIEGDLYHLTPGYCGLEFKLPSEVESIPTHAFFALDRSGSMNGSPIIDARNALSTFVSKLQKLNIPITVYAFNHFCEEQSSNVIGYQGLETYCRSITAKGQTNFHLVLKCIAIKMRELGCKSGFIVFLSDGKDTMGLEHLRASLEKFKKLVEDNNMSVGVHCIGFSEEHDAYLLGTLCRWGTKEGTFQYIPKGGRIPIAVNNTFEYVITPSASATYTTNKGSHKLKLHALQITHTTGENTHSGENTGGLQSTIYLDKSEFAESLKIGINLCIKGENKIVNLVGKEQTFSSIAQEVHFFCDFVSHIILELIEEGMEYKNLSYLLKNVKPVAIQMRERIKDIMERVSRLKSLERKQLIPFLESSNDLITGLYTVIATSAGKEVTNIQMAQLNALAFQNSLKRSLEKKLEKKAGNNIIMLKEIEAEINRIITPTVDYDPMSEIEKRYSEVEIEDKGRCLISLLTWSEAFRNGDCLCLTFDAIRPVSGIVDPSLLTITTLNTTVLSAESFISSALFHQKAGQLITGVTFDRERSYANTLVNGLPEELITGIIPMYITPEHWRIARLRMKPLLGWTTTLDVLGYGTDQLLVIPFLVLAKGLLGVQHSQFKKEQFEDILNVCKTIILENRHLIVPKVEEIYKNYNASPQVRTIDSVPNNRVFLGQLACAWQMDMTEFDYETFIILMRNMLAEEIRRTININEKMTPHQMIVKILEIDTRKYTKEILKPGEYPEETKEIMPPVLGAEIGKMAGSTLQSLEERMKKGKTYEMLKLMELFDFAPFESLEEAGYLSPSQKLTLLIESIIYAKNKDMREAIMEGRYVSPLNKEECNIYINMMHKRAVEQEMNAARTAILKKVMESQGAQNAGLFRTTRDIGECSLLVKGMTRGSPQFMQYVKALQASGVPLVIPKLGMLITGQFMGFKLIEDKMNKQSVVVNTWKPKKFHIFRVWKENKQAGTVAEWKQAIGDEYGDYIQRQILRESKTFIPYSKPRTNCKDTRHNWGAIGLAKLAAVKGQKMVTKIFGKNVGHKKK